MTIDLPPLECLAGMRVRTGLAAIEVEEAGQSLRLVMDRPIAASPVRAASTAAVDDASVVAKADVAGHFLAAHPWRAKPFVEAGQRIQAGAIVGLVKVGLIYAPVVAPAAGVVDAVIAETGAPVGYGTPIARIRPVAA
jgi:biotin carboxyl carrier protein